MLMISSLILSPPLHTYLLDCNKFAKQECFRSLIHVLVLVPTLQVQSPSQVSMFVLPAGLQGQGSQ